MDNAWQMHTEDLQRRFSRDYKDFFNTHNMVLSAPGILTWWADISHGASVLRIKQKIPLKSYIGVNFNTSWAVTFGTIFTYDILSGTFRKNPFKTVFQHDISSVIACLETYFLGKGFTSGISIDFLSEAPPGHGFAFSSVVAVLLTVMASCIAGEVDAKSFKAQGLSTESPLLESLFQMSLELSRCIAGNNSIGSGSNYTILLSAVSSPTIILWEKYSSHGEGNVPITEQGISDESTTPIYKNTLLNFLGITSIPHWEVPLDFGIIFTGLEYRFDEIDSKRKEIREDEEHLGKFIRERMENISQTLSVPELRSNILDFYPDRVLPNTIEMMNLTILEGFDTLIHNRYKDRSAEVFIGSMQQIGLSSFSYQKENKLFFALQHTFHQLQQFDDEMIAFLPFNTGKIGGSLLFVMKKGKSQITLQKVLEHMRDEGHIVALDHASWRDGTLSDGVQIEQFLHEKIYSEYTKAGDIRFSDSHGNSYCGDYRAILEKESDIILLDTIEGTIRIRGERLTSKDIHSQNSTIDMLSILLEHMGETVSNSRLPLSTYSQNKNELLSKVVLPIKKLSKKYFWTELSLSCTGWVTEYFLTLEKDSDIRIGIIRILNEN